MAKCTRHNKEYPNGGSCHKCVVEAIKIQKDKKKKAADTGTSNKKIQ